MGVCYLDQIIDNALLKQLDEAIKLYIDDDIQCDESKVAVISLLVSYHSRMNDINFLINNHRLNSANVLMRVAFETYVYLKYIFEKNNRMKNRAKAYYFHDFQKFSYYLQHLDQTSITTTDELIADLNKSKNKKVLGPHKNVNNYFNDMRAKFRKCFVIKDQKLDFQLLKDSDKFKKCKIDSWKWYNDDGKTLDFLHLVTRLNLIDEYAAIYAPTSDDIHSDGLQHQLQFSRNQITVQESFDPLTLVFFRGSILELIQTLGKYIHSSQNRRKVTQRLQKARTIYLARHSLHLLKKTTDPKKNQWL